VLGPFPELVGGVTQIQQTIQYAVRQIGKYIADIDEEGADLTDGTYQLFGLVRACAPGATRTHTGRILSLKCYEAPDGYQGIGRQWTARSLRYRHVWRQFMPKPMPKVY
jgi:hypothetical protein